MDKHVLNNCIEWNEGSRRRAMVDAGNHKIRVPGSATKVVYEGSFKPKNIPLTPDEYRAERAKDAERFAQNIMALRQRRADR